MRRTIIALLALPALAENGTSAETALKGPKALVRGRCAA